MFEKDRVGSAVEAVLGIPDWVKYITSPGSLKERLTEFVARVLRELQPEINKLVAARDEARDEIEVIAVARDDALKQAKWLNGELAKLKQRGGERFPSDVWDVVVEIWRKLREGKGIFVPENLAIEPKRAMARAYMDAGNDIAAARKVGEREMDRLVAENKTEPWNGRDLKPKDPEDNEFRAAYLKEE